MKYKIFKENIENIIKLYTVLSERDQRLQDALGGDTVVLTNDVFCVIDKMTETLAREFNDTDGLIDFLIFENMLSINYSKKNNRMEVDGKDYPVTPKTIWKLLRKGNSK